MTQGSVPRCRSQLLRACQRSGRCSLGTRELARSRELDDPKHVLQHMFRLARAVCGIPTAASYLAPMCGGFVGCLGNHTAVRCLRTSGMPAFWPLLARDTSSPAFGRIRRPSDPCFGAISAISSMPAFWPLLAGDTSSPAFGRIRRPSDPCLDRKSVV